MHVSAGWEFALWFFVRNACFCEQKSEIAICAHSRSFKKSDGVKRDGSDSLLGIKIGKQSKTVTNSLKTTIFFNESLVFESESAIHSLKTSALLTSFFTLLYRAT